MAKVKVLCCIFHCSEASSASPLPTDRIRLDLTDQRNRVILPSFLSYHVHFSRYPGPASVCRWQCDGTTALYCNASQKVNATTLYRTGSYLRNNFGLKRLAGFMTSNASSTDPASYSIGTVSHSAASLNPSYQRKTPSEIRKRSATNMVRISLAIQ